MALVLRGLDLIGALLCARPGARPAGLTHLAVGTGDPSWDTGPPPPDRARTALTREVARVRITALRHEAGVITARAVLPDLGGELREVGLFGGDASSRPGSGYLVSHIAHPPAPVPRAREVRLALPPGLAPGVRDLIGGLLAGEAGLTGISHVALGTDGDPGDPDAPPSALLAEAYRVPVDRRRLRYDQAAHAVLLSARFGIGEGPPVVREAAVFAGDVMVVRETGPEVDRTRPRALEHAFTIALVARLDVPVPELTGLGPEEARDALSAAGLVAGTITEREAQGRDAATVVAQSPRAGGTVHEGTPVDVVVEIPARVAVPPLIGEPVGRAAALLETIGLAVGELTDAQSETPPGTVLAVAPPQGTRLAPGTVVALTVAVPVQVIVPDVRGRTPAAAELLLRGARLSAADPPYAQEESPVTAGTVIRQEPAAGTSAPVGASVTVTLAAPLAIAVPGLTGRSLEEAPALLEAASAARLKELGLLPVPPALSLGRRIVEAGDRPEGEVVRQEPAEGTRVPLHSTVDVTVSGLPERSVPDLTGLALAAARAALSTAGFTLGRQQGRASDAESGTVLGQDPPPGSVWPPGAPVAVTVATGRTVPVPELAGLIMEAAREAAAARGLTLTETTRTVPGRPGTVHSQSPAPGTEVASGSAVGIVVRAGVPALVGLPLDEARDLLESLGLEADATLEETDGPAGLVLRQDPAPERPVPQDGTVRVVVSALRTVEVPDVVGLLFDEAAQLLDEAELAAAVLDSEFSDEPEDTVLAQAPGAEERVPVFTLVALTLAMKPPVRVPRVTGLPVAEAKRALEEAGLRIKVTGSRPVLGAREESVVEQDPAEGTETHPGTVVRVVLATRVKTVVVPELRGLTVQQAGAKLEAAQLSAGIVEDVPGDQPRGTVVGQNPRAGEAVPPGTAVALSVAAPRRVAVPSTVGMLFDVAFDALTERGFVVTHDYETSFTVAGIVIRQVPGGGTLEPGSTVLVILSLGWDADPRSPVVRPPVKPPIRFPIELPPRPPRPSP
ncbi:hypothetical protein GCM10010156_40730 [Planobispora rosea]|uniref:PASTA domain-containing protein n=1 Tax=Planobispora rosea TaxID=35762 RepID=A0A8J3S5Y8_PLARO|nr:PASTA domain-containing protein [Planobispora rosea]GGS77795.1 hypothetical protein GCM10010156_40730 [Planobispora rosea]GIH85599.1 hypothetical protein Pro02_40070 [Planobispora rosea]